MKKMFVLVCILSAPCAFAMEIRDVCNSHNCVVVPNKVDISGLDKKILLNALYQRAQPVGCGLLRYKANHTLSDEEMESILSRGGDTDYVHGRVMKINVSGNSVNTLLYNRDNGEGAAESVIESLRQYRALQSSDKAEK